MAYILGLNHLTLSVCAILKSVLEYLPQWLLVIAAFFGLKTWKKKLAYERRLGVVDNFYNAVHGFILKASSSIGILKFIEVGIQEYEESFKGDPKRSEAFTCGLQEFIEASGGRYSIQLRSILDDIDISRIYSLSIKIDALKLKDIKLATDCYKQLKFFYETIMDIANKTSMNGLYWDNPEVEKYMNQLSELDIESLRESLMKAEKLMLEFSRNNYN